MRWYNPDGTPAPTKPNGVPTAEYFESIKDRRVASTKVWPGWWVSTVFLGLDHQYFEGGEPRIYETMVFHLQHGGRDFEMKRYGSRQDALVGHERMVRKMRRRRLQGLFQFLRR